MIARRKNSICFSFSAGSRGVKKTNSHGKSIEGSEGEEREA